MKRLKRRDDPHLRAEPNEDAWEALKDAENIGRDARRREQLRSYTGEDEITQNGHHEVHNHVTVNLPQPSQPDTQVDVETSVEIGPFKARGVPRWVVLAAATLVAAVTALVAHFAGR